MSGETREEKATRQSAQAATKTVQQGAADYTASPEYQQITALVGQILANPTTLTPQAVDAMNRQAIADANRGAREFLVDKQTMSQAPGGAGYRSGSARDAEIQAASMFGENLASANRQVELAQAERRIPDLITAANAGQSLLQNKFGLQQSVANAQLGQAGILSQLAQIPSPAQQLGSGLGGVLGGVLTAGTSSKGVFKG